MTRLRFGILGLSFGNWLFCDFMLGVVAEFSVNMCMENPSKKEHADFHSLEYLQIQSLSPWSCLLQPQVQKKSLNMEAEKLRNVGKKICPSNEKTFAFNLAIVAIPKSQATVFKSERFWLRTENIMLPFRCLFCCYSPVDCFLQTRTFGIWNMFSKHWDYMFQGREL